MSKKEQIDELTKKIDKIIKSYKRLDDICTTANELGAMDYEGKIFRSIWKSFEDLLGMIDGDYWISWYIYENNCGKNAMKAGRSGKTKPIRTSRQLAQLILNDK